MKRREFLRSGAAVIAGAGLARGLGTEANATPQGAEIAVGDFLVRIGPVLAVAHKREPDRLLWETAHDGNFVVLEKAVADVHGFGTPQGSYTITDKVSDTYMHASIGSLEAGAVALLLSGIASGEAGAIPFTLTFTALSPTRLRFEISTQGSGSGVNRIRLRLQSARDEAFFGFGEQLTYFNQKGNVLPMLVQEHGVGRGRPIVTQLVDALADGGGRNPYITEAPAPHFISSRLRSMFLENTEYSLFDMRPADHADIKLWSGAMRGQIAYGQTPLDLIEAYTEYAGRMRVLPDWVHGGVIVAVQGGTEAVRGKLSALRKAGVPLAGLWIQDWSGIRVTSVGKQLWWDWKLDESFYPGWSTIVADLEASGARMLIYINPFLANTPGHDTLFKEGESRGYLVERADGTPYLIKNSDFSAGLIDLSNPDTRRWIKDVIKNQLIGAAGASGWMADFGEALPFDAKLHGGADPSAWHNHFPEAWAKVNREAIEEAGRGEDIVFFNRSGFTQSPGAATLFWLGDQLQTWDQYDGIKSAVVGMLSGGVSGFSLLHGDAGGYVTLSLKVAGHKLPVIARSNELLQRWMELAAFTAVFRTHEGLDPDICAQFDSDPANAAQLARCGKIYKALAPYRKQLVAEAAQRGAPVVRHPFLHYPNDPNTHALRYQFLLGTDVMVAPALDKGADSVEVYFPKGSAWTNLWTGEAAGMPGTWERMPAPLGKPAVFLREGAASGAGIIAALKAEGVY